MQKKKNNDVGRYRSCAAIFIVNKDKKIFVGKRIGTESWQIPQGGIDENEQIEIAVFRELFEETGITKEKAEIIACHPHEIFYDVPAEKRPKSWNDKKYCGQKVLCFFLKFHGTNDDIDLKKTNHPEFSEFSWEAQNNLCKTIPDFKKEMYKKILEYFEEISDLFS
jgi:putative (di)nucleoside polyphosphate hydrolase